VDKVKKHEFVTWLNETFKKSGSVVVAHCSGLTVAQMNELRCRMRESGGSIKIARNSLARIALHGIEAEGMADLFTGQTLIAYACDPLAAPKVTVDFTKSNEKLVILGGAMGTTSLNVEGVLSLASLPSLNDLRARLVGTISRPATRIMQVLIDPVSKMVQIFEALARKEEEEMVA